MAQISQNNICLEWVYILSWVCLLVWECTTLQVNWIQMEGSNSKETSMFFSWANPILFSAIIPHVKGRRYHHTDQISATPQPSTAYFSH